MKILQATEWIEAEKSNALTRLIKWAHINSWSENKKGLQQMADELLEAFAPLSDTHERLVLPNGDALSFIKRKNAKMQILLGGHMDTVYPPLSSFQMCKEEKGRLIGPGVADMKGGLIVLWLGLSAFEKFGNVENLGWEVFINPDEEIGSPGSSLHWEEKAKTASLGLLFEPSFADGALVTMRKGSMNFHLTVQGIAAHAGRDFTKGKSAIKAIGHFIAKSYACAENYPELSLNIAGLHSDSPLNVVAEHAVCSLNIRSFNQTDLQKLRKELEELAFTIGSETETIFNLSCGLEKKPKLFTEKTKVIFDRLQECAKGTLITRPSGGLSDGNILAKAGLPCLDTLGVIGGNLHTSNEYMEIESLGERAKLFFLFLCSLIER